MAEILDTDILRVEITYDTSLGGMTVGRLSSSDSVDSGKKYKIDWGDGNIDEDAVGIYHTYTASGIYTIKCYNNKQFSYSLRDLTGRSGVIEAYTHPGLNRIYCTWGMGSDYQGGFRSCENLKKVVINSPGITINPYSFENCFKLEELFIGEDTILDGSSIGSNVSRDAINSTIFISKGMTFGADRRSPTIIVYSYPKKIIFMDGVQTISNTHTSAEPSLFEQCPGLVSVTIPASVTSIRAGTFRGLTSDVQHIYYQGTAEQWNTLQSNIGSGNSRLLAAQVHIVSKLSYILNGGILPEGTDNPMFVSDFPSLMPVPTLANYIFDDWYKESTFGTKVTPGASLSSETTVYARFYNTITYNLDGAANNALNKAEYTSVDVASALPIYAPMKAGYDFAGWYTDSAFTTEVTDMSDFDGSAITLYAKFNEKERYVAKEKLADGSLKELFLDAATVKGHDAYININLSSMTYMRELYAKVVDINARNEHAYFDASSFIPGAYVCLVLMTETDSLRKCEIIDMLHNVSYYNEDGFDLDEEIDDYITSCVRKDIYANVKISDLTTMSELKAFVDNINSRGDHVFFDFSDYVPGAYVCLVQMYTDSAINYCFIYDMLNGKLYGNYTGYSGETEIEDYVAETVSDIVHAITITDPDMTLAQVIQMINRVNTIGHHVFLDVSAISSADYLATFTYEGEEPVLCTAMGLVKGTYAYDEFLPSELQTTTLAEFLAGADSLRPMTAEEFNEVLITFNNAVNGVYDESTPPIPPEPTPYPPILYKGEIINIDMNGDGDPEMYRVLKSEGRATEVVAMSSGGKSQFGSSKVYAESTLDTYLNITWYSTLSETAKAAIIDKTFRQDSWYTSNNGHPVYSGYSGATKPGTNEYVRSLGDANFGSEITRHVYALSVQDILDYVLDTDITDGQLQNYNVWKMLWNDEVTHSEYPWLRSAVASSSNRSFNVSGLNGYVTDNALSNSNATRPAFTIDLSKIPFTRS